MRCEHCGAEIIRIKTMGGPAICWASPTIYWPVRDNKAQELLTSNGSSVYGSLAGEPQDAVGIGYLPHTCHQMFLLLQGRDSWDRPVYNTWLMLSNCRMQRLNTFGWIWSGTELTQVKILIPTRSSPA